MIRKLIHFFRSETVLTVSALAALLSAVFVPPDMQYGSYFDLRVLSLLFCLMAVVAGITKVGAFEVISQQLMERSKNIKMLSIILVLLCFFSAMFITNDVALLTFVPLTIAVLGITREMTLIFVVVLQTVAANLGSMLTPVGNPQNLYLYSYYDMNTLSFLRTTFPLWLLGLVLIIFATLLLIRGGEIQIAFQQKVAITDRRQLLLYLVLFLLCLLTVAGVVPYYVTLGVVVLALLFVDRTLFGHVDYSLLITFICFFIFVGNLSRMDAVRSLVFGLIEGREMLSAIVLSQAISNVPAAVMLSSFTTQGTMLVVGSNIGGLGTLVASLASLISYKLYARSEHAKTGRYMLVFTAINAAFLVMLCLFAIFWY